MTEYRNNSLEYLGWDHMRFLILLILFLPISSVSIAQDYSKIENSLTQYISIKGQKSEKFNILDRMEKHNVPGVSIAIVHGNKLAWFKTWGLKNTSTGAVVEAETLFQAASISKPMTAIAALRLVEEGLLTLDDPINNFLKRWKVPQNNFTKETPVTLRGLLTHTAGTSVSGFPGYKHNDNLPTVVQILNGEKPANTGAVIVDGEPNTRWRYSGGGYTIAQLAMEDVTGLEFPDIMRKYVLDPFGMENSTFEIRLSDEQLQKTASAHNRKGEALGTADNVDEGNFHLYPEMAAASLWTNPKDLAKAIIHTNNIYHQNMASILSDALAKEMFKIHAGNQGLGYQLEVSKGKVVGFGHDGSNQGFKANLTAFLDGRALIMMTNGENGSMLMNEIFYGVFDLLDWPEHPVQDRDSRKMTEKIRHEYAGTYHYEEGDRIRNVKLVKTKDGLNITFGDFINSMKLYPFTDSKELKFFVLSGHEVTLDKLKDGTNAVRIFGMTFNKID